MRTRGGLVQSSPRPAGGRWIGAVCRFGASWRSRLFRLAERACGPAVAVPAYCLAAEQHLALF
eukprot:9843922-Lingulodinium_polyedra.AAC.1